jgi:hypothetical protein
MPNDDETKDKKAKPKVIHTAALEAEMEDRWDDALLNGIRKGRQQRAEQKAREAKESK